MNMRKFIVSGIILACLAPTINAEPMCKVVICNKLDRFTLNPFSMLKDSLGEQCFDAMLPKSSAVKGKELSSESRWYQGSFNPTKRSVTYVKEVNECK